MPDVFTHQWVGQSPSATFLPGIVVAVSGGWLPPVEYTLPLAERVRAALMRASQPEVPWQFSGKDEIGRPRRGHQHVYVLPFATTDAARTRRLNRVLLWIETGFDPSWSAVKDLMAGSLSVFSRSRPPLRLQGLEYGDRGMFAESLEPRLRELVAGAHRWESVAPFVPPRHTKRRRGEWLDTPAQQISQLCDLVLGRAPYDVQPLEPENWWPSLVQCREKDRPRFAKRPVSGWRLEFSQPIRGPIALGYGSHFGLGCFAAIT